MSGTTLFYIYDSPVLGQWQQEQNSTQAGTMFVQSGQSQASGKDTRSDEHTLYLNYTQIAADYLWGKDFGGASKVPKTSVQTPSIPAPPIPYATSRPAHQYNVQNSRGPHDLPIWPNHRVLASIEVTLPRHTYPNSYGFPICRPFHFLKPRSCSNYSVQSRL